MPRVSKIDFPAASRLQARLARATYRDAFEAPLADDGLSATEIARRAFSATPGWVEGLLDLRDAIVRPLGLKTVGHRGRTDGRAAGTPRVGDRFSIFQVESVDEAELVLGIDDTHLDVRISCLKRQVGGQATWAIGSLVQTHNLLGRVYMIPVGRFHPVLVRLMMSRLRV